MPPSDGDKTLSTQGALERARWERGLGRIALVALPISTVVVIAFAIFVVGAPRSYRAARVWGGTTVSQDQLSFRVQVIDRLGELEQPVASVPLTVSVSAGDQSVSWEGSSDSEGFCHPAVGLSTGASGRVAVEVTQGSFPLASGTVSLSISQWKLGARRRGGWTRGRVETPFSIRARPVRGAFAVPFADPLLVEVRDANGPVKGATLSFAPEGGRVQSLEDPVVSDSQGRAEVLFLPEEHHPALSIEVEFEGRHGRWHSTLPVVPGAMHARVQGESLLVRSPIVRDRVYFDIVSEKGRLAGGVARLTPDGQGGAQALVPLRAQLTNPSWAVVSSEPDLRSPASVGWPLLYPKDQARTFDVPDRLVLDGAPAGHARAARVYRNARWLAAGYALLSLGLVLLLLFRRVKEADARLAEHLGRQASGTQRNPAAQRMGLTLLVAVLAVSLGFVLVLLLALYRIGSP